MFDLYIILPPIIIVISLALIIFLISRKSLEIEKNVLDSGIKEEQNSRLIISLKSKVLHLLERISHWFKIFSLKFHNWNESKLKNLRRKKTEVKNINDNITNIKNKNPLKIIPDVRKINIQVSRREQEEMRARKQEAKRRKRDYMEGAMVSKKAVYPDDVRKELEEALIERIASDPRDIEAYERLGDYYISQSKDDDACECYKQVLKLNSQNLTVRNKLERLKNGAEEFKL